MLTTLDRDDPLIDARTGVVTALERFTPGPDAPAGWVGWSARVSDTARFGDFQADRYGFGAALLDSDRARLAALGEACERYCGNAVPADLPRATWNELDRDGLAAVDPDTVALYSDEQYGSPGFPFVPITRDTPISWVAGRCMHTRTPTLVPASLSYLNYFVGAHAHEQATNSVPYAGIAAGVDRRHAELSALEEILERDATSIWWASGAPADLVDHPSVGSMGPGCVVRLLSIPNEVGAPVIACFVEDADRAIIAFGSSCKADPRQAAEKALVESYAMFELTTEVADPRSALWEASARGDFHAHTFKEFRSDRRYRDSFDPQLRDMVDLPTLAQYYLDPRTQGEPLDRLRAHSSTVDLARIAAVDADDPLRRYLDMLDDNGFRAYSVSLTTDDVRAAGREVVRVVVPGMYGNAPAAFPYLGGRRLHTVPATIGLTDGPLAPGDIYPHPIPHV